jgi:GDP-L-fucose synthase
MGKLENKKMNKELKLFITGHRGMLGSATFQLFKDNGYSNIITATHSELEITNQQAVEDFFEKEKPEYVIHIAAKVGGINANILNPAIFLYDNLIMQANLINTSFKYNVKKFLFIGSSCIYPKDCPQPMKEEYILTGKLEPTNEGYAIGKIAGIKLLEAYNKQYGFNSITLIPSNTCTCVILFSKKNCRCERAKNKFRNLVGDRNCKKRVPARLRLRYGYSTFL